MSKASTFLAILFMGFFLLVLSPAQALEIDIDEAGTMRFYDDYVLGETTEKTVDQRRPNKIVPRSARKDLSVKATARTTDVELKKRSLNKREDGVAGFDSVEKTRASNLKIGFPSRANRDGDTNLDEDSRRSQYMDKLKDERQTRFEEMTELRNRDKDGKQSLELRSRNVRANINGAQFTLDSATNEVLLTTPSGNQHVLKHLPDQALERMKAVGLFTSASSTGEDVLEAVVTDDGVSYRAKIKAHKRVFGLFKREIDAEVVLDDETGEISQEDTPSNGVFGRFLDAVSF